MVQPSALHNANDALTLCRALELEGDHEQALEWCERAAALADRHGFLSVLSSAKASVFEISALIRGPAEAWRASEGALEAAHLSGQPRSIGLVRIQRGLMAMQEDSPERALEEWRHASCAVQPEQAPMVAATALLGLAVATALLDRWEDVPYHLEAFQRAYGDRTIVPGQLEQMVDGLRSRLLRDGREALMAPFDAVLAHVL
jgi:tetratricopeptide (TPR) repeat protein